jgi:hypothetical protein
MMKCLNCDKCTMTTDEIGYAETRCCCNSKKGKIITWAYTTCTEGGVPIEYGRDRVIKYMQKVKTPYWCKNK